MYMYVHACMSITYMYHVSFRVTVPSSPFITWSGDDHPGAEDFSKYNNKSVEDVIRRYKGITVNGTLLNFM